MKRYLVTGITSGIGNGVCKALLSEGHEVLGIGRNLQAIEGIVCDRLHFKQFDLSDIEAIESEVFNDFCARFGKLTGMVLCAGIEDTAPLILQTPPKVQHIFNINVLSQLEFFRQFSKKKFSNDRSSVIFLSSVMGILGQPGKITYSATKASLLGIVKSAALEVAKREMRVNAILPGIIKTPLVEKLFKELDDAGIQKIIDMHPLGLGGVEDVANTVLFLLSDKSRWITGQGIVIDGGYSIH